VLGGDRRGLGAIGLGQKVVEIVAGELPLERRGDLFVAAAERQEMRLQRVEVGKVVGGQTDFGPALSMTAVRGRRTRGSWNVK